MIVLFYKKIMVSVIRTVMAFCLIGVSVLQIRKPFKSLHTELFRFGKLIITLYKALKAFSSFKGLFFSQKISKLRKRVLAYGLINYLNCYMDYFDSFLSYCFDKAGMLENIGYLSCLSVNSDTKIYIKLI